MGNGTFTYRVQIVSDTKVQVVKRDPQNALRGEEDGQLRFAAHQAALQPLCQRAHEGSITKTEIWELGPLLFQTLFDEALATDFLTFYDEIVQTKKALLRIELDIDPDLPHLNALPWEYICTPPQSKKIAAHVFLATTPGLIFSRRRKAAIPPKEILLGPEEKLKIAVVISAPNDAGLEMVSYRKLFTELQAWKSQLTDDVEVFLFDPETHPATGDKLDEILEVHTPHIFHFVGHGRFQNNMGEIAIVRDNGQARWINAAQFSSFFLRHRPSVVLLQACEGGKTSALNPFASVASQILKHNIPVVVAMQHSISNATARRFALEFYRRLAQNKPVDNAVQEGRYKISDIHETRDFASPVLYMQDRHGRLFNRALITLRPPPVAVQSETLRQALSRLNYTPQRDKFSQVLWKPQKMGAFLITGPPEAGHQWLLRLLVEEIRSPDSANNPKQLDVGNRIYIRLGIERLWGDLGEKMGLAFGAAPEAVRAKIISEWQHQDILLILHNVAKNDPDFVQTVIDELWQPLAQDIMENPPASLDTYWLTLFLVDNEGELGQTNLEITEISTPAWQPNSPVQLPTLSDQFVEADLQQWLSQRDVRDAVATANLPLPQLVQTVLAESAGFPMETLKSICRLCNQNWSDVEKVWLKL